ncbi:MAG: hypothetical protein LBH50_05485 [Spirochaetaceae bacterium]|jgi:hypothetical protein|nr:hypothetical protein [Spirochaetaceae bacterium]
MSVKNEQPELAFFDRIKRFAGNLSETSVFAAWFIAITLTGALFWGCSAGLRDSITIRTVNRFLTGIGESRRIESAVSTWNVPGRVTQIGTWYTMTSAELAVIFPLVTDGIFSPYLAIIDSDGRLGTLVPLTANGDKILPRTNPGYLQIWIDRIEKNAAILEQSQDERDRRRMQ